MFQLDDNFLKDLGLDNLPEEQKQAFLQHIYDELELRVGTRLAEGLSDEQLEQFEALVARDQEVVQSWLASNVADYRNQEDFQRFVAATGSNADDQAVISEYAATKWLETNRPDYRSVVADVLDQLKGEIVSNRDSILGKQ